MPKDLTPLKRSIEVFRVIHRDYGCRRMLALLNRNGLNPSRSEVRRAYVELGILGKVRRKRVRTTCSTHQFPRYSNLCLDTTYAYPDQVWVGDVTGIYIEGRWAYLALLMDVYTRFIVGWSMSLSNDTALTLRALRLGLELQRSPEIHHSDQGANYASGSYQDTLLARGIKISMSAAGKPRQNAHAERLNRTVKQEEVYKAKYKSLEEAKKAIGKFVLYYNGTRLHTGIACKPPAEAFEQWKELTGM